MMDSFNAEKQKNIRLLGEDKSLLRLSQQWIAEVSRHKYCYNFTWLGRPIIQFPQDIIALQEIIWQVKPDIIIETGIAHGGSLILHASLLELLGQGEVLGIDIDIRSHNRKEIERHPLYKRIIMLEGSSTDEEIVAQVYQLCKNKSNILVILDANHTHEHVIKELELYSPLVTVGSYLIVMDTIVEDLPNELFLDRPWEKGNNPKIAVETFLKSTDRFIIDEQINSKLLISAAPDGYLKCIS